MNGDAGDRGFVRERDVRSQLSVGAVWDRGTRFAAASTPGTPKGALCVVFICGSGHVVLIAALMRHGLPGAALLTARTHAQMDSCVPALQLCIQRSRIGQVEWRTLVSTYHIMA
jgi:hypothetical protein